ncbi:uncharacterized protein LOC131927641 [Physella acuta]|uniref:uncharacterized protein LOC131927641 n=1 Tax=Physella acuta TaxID=109671 RepID=UPI0027DDF9AE|nr:uncharacterized protein LOC131927641 [Physella acuta]
MSRSSFVLLLIKHASWRMDCRYRSVSTLLRKYLVLMGCIMLLMPVSVSVYFGNFLTYLASYYHAHMSRVYVWVDPLWLSSAFKILQPIGMIFAGFIETKSSLKTGILVGAVIQSASVILSYWAVQEPLALLLCFGIAQGVAGGILLALPYKLAAETFPEKRGFAFGILSTGPSIFPLLHMLLSYYLINPSNIATDIQINNIRYFTDPEVIERVPPFFLKIGLFTFALQLVGFILIQCRRRELNPSDDGQTEELLVGSKPGEEEKEDYDNIAGEIYKEKDNVSAINESVSSESNVKDTYEKLNDQTIVEIRTGDVAATQELKEKEMFEVGEVKSGDEKSKTCSEIVVKDLTPREMLCTLTFWKVWTIFALMGHTFFIHLNLYKQFGLTVINNDNTLVMTGTISTFVLMVFRPLVGFMSDKYGLKPVLVTTCACSNFFMTMMPISLYTFPPLYIVFVALEFYATSSVKVFYYMTPMALFGEKHFASNVGFMSASQWVVYFLGPIVVPPLIKSIGWTNVFLTGSVAAALAFFLSLTVPDLEVKKKK